LVTAFSDQQIFSFTTKHNYLMADTLIPALVLLGIMGLIIAILKFVHNRDSKRDAVKRLNNNQQDH
jgi:hypothetical protein